MNALSRLALLSAFTLVVAGAVTGCAGPEAEEDSGVSAGSDLVKTTDAHWVYDGPLEPLADAKVTVSLRGHTARLTGYLSRDLDLSALPHLRKTQDGGRIRVDAVYPIATGAQASYNSRPGLYPFQDARPYRPDSIVENEFGKNLVPWGGFPFLNYNSGVALHGPITSIASKSNQSLEVFYLRRGRVSHGCNRMLGEHVTELTHALGVSMRKIYEPGKAYRAPQGGVTILADFDSVDGKVIDVDYPTDTTDPGNIRPKSVYSEDKITMFGSWVASELPDGSDLPADMKWEAGKKDDLYVFAEHAQHDWVCSIPQKDLEAARRYASTQPDHELPRGFCKKKDCALAALAAGQDLKATCGL